MPAKAIILVDFEQEWINNKSEYYVGNIDSVIKRTNKLVDFCRSKGYKIIFITHIEKGSSNAFSERTDSTKIIPSLHKEDSDILIKKYKISPFYKTNLDQELKGIKDVIVCGILANLCVRSTIQDAYDRDFNVTVIKDCCVSFDKKTQDFTFKDLKATREELNFIDLKRFLKQ